MDNEDDPRYGPIKLMDFTSGKLIGYLDIPTAWRDILHRQRECRFYFSGPFRYPKIDEQLSASINTRRCAIHTSITKDGADAYSLWGITLEEFQTVPGCAFYPGIGYIQDEIARMLKAKE
jgi:hypothetical protein